MRIFYLYDVNDTFYKMYKEYPYKLYKILEDIYITSKYDKNIVKEMYEQINCKYNKSFMNNYIKNKNNKDIYYYNKDNIHIISNRHEYCKLSINNHYIKIKSSINYTKYFEQLNNFSENIFVCDYDNNDYFWLDKIIKIKNKNEDNLIKQ